MTRAERILAGHSGKTEVAAGDFVCVSIDLVYARKDVLPAVERTRTTLGLAGTFTPANALLLDDLPWENPHAATGQRQTGPASSVDSFTSVSAIHTGIDHVALRELGAALPGALVVGSEPAVCTLGAFGAFATLVGATDIPLALATGEMWMRVPVTIKLVYYGDLPQWASGVDLALFTVGDLGTDGALYSAVEIGGPAVDGLDIMDRRALASIATEIGAKTIMLQVDSVTAAYLGLKDAISPANQDSANNECAQVIEYNVSRISPQVALLNGSLTVMAAQEARDLTVRHIAVGGAAGGDIDDLRLAADILSGRHVHPETSCAVVTRTREVLAAASEEGLIDTLQGAGATVSCRPPQSYGELDRTPATELMAGCSVCTCADSYATLLSGPAVAAASAVFGRIASPAELLQ
jgi:3-isopropylmalate/(R)-2-methylmalate dehydratase large subunit